MKIIIHTLSHSSQPVARSSERGVTTLLAVGFMGVLMLVVGTISSYVFQQSKYGRALFAREQALSIAESGLEYYKWFLARTPGATQTGAGLVSPYTYTVSDPEGGTLGSAEVTATAALQCGRTQWIDIASKGTANADTRFPRTISARYMRPSVAEYSYIVGENVFAGSDRTIRGPYHTNGGVRMDATHNSDVTSAVQTWNCTSNYGCNPAQPTAPGVVGNGSNPIFWSYPVTSISFDTISVDLANLQGYAQSGGGLYFGPASGDPNSRGYHLVFNSGGTVTVYRVTSTTGVWGYSTPTGWQMEYNIIAGETLVGTYAIPASCGVVFVEDRVWVEGTVQGKVLVAAATPTDGSTSPDALLKGNILYASNDGTNGLTVVAERNILFPLNAPETMEIHGIFVAQSGRYGHNYYVTSGSTQVPSQYDSYVIKTQLTTVGTVVSRLRTGTAWSSGGSTVAGFASRNDFYDRVLAFSPPPFTSVASADYGLQLWREQ